MAWTSAVMAFLISMGIFQGPKPADEGPVYLGTVTAPASVPAGQSVVVAIEGNLPTPAYVLVEPGIQRKDHVVTIHLASHVRHKGPSIQMLAPFTRNVALADLDAGDWTIVVDTPNGDHQEVQVQVSPRP